MRLASDCGCIYCNAAWGGCNTPTSMPGITRSPWELALFGAVSGPCMGGRFTQVNEPIRALAAGSMGQRW